MFFSGGDDAHITPSDSSSLNRPGLSKRSTSSPCYLPPFVPLLHPLAYSGTTQSRGSGRPWVPLVIYSYEQMQRTGAEHTASARLTVCVCVSVPVCASVCVFSSVALPSNQISHHTSPTLTQQQSTGDLGQKWPTCLLPYIFYMSSGAHDRKPGKKIQSGTRESRKFGDIHKYFFFLF